jgi:hypothetical protein
LRKNNKKLRNDGPRSSGTPILRGERFLV